MAWTPDPRDLEDGSRPTDPLTAALARAARYSRWDGRQAVPDMAADELLDALSEDLLEEGDLADALRRLKCAELINQGGDGARRQPVAPCGRDSIEY